MTQTYAEKMGIKVSDPALLPDQQKVHQFWYEKDNEVIYVHDAVVEYGLVAIWKVKSWK